MSIALTPEEHAFKEAYIRSRGYWVAFNDGLRRHNPRWLEAYLSYADAAQREGPLDARMRELIFVAVDASTTHLYLQGLEIHIRKAFACGCEAADLIEVLLIAARQGLDSVVAGIDILAEEAPETVAIDAAATTPLLDRYATARRDRPDWLARLATIAPGYVQALIELIEVAEGEARLTARARACASIARGIAHPPQSTGDANRGPRRFGRGRDLRRVAGGVSAGWSARPACLRRWCAGRHLRRCRTRAMRTEPYVDHHRSPAPGPSEARVVVHFRTKAAPPQARLTRAQIDRRPT